MAGEGVRRKGRSCELVFGDITSEKDAQRIRDGHTARRKEFFSAAGADRVRLQRSGHRGRRRRESVAADPATGGDGRRRRALRGGKLPAAEERLRRGGRRICESAGEQSEIGGGGFLQPGVSPGARPGRTAA